MSNNRLYFDGTFYRGTTSTGECIYVSPERLQQRLSFALENDIDVNICLNPDMWVVLIPDNVTDKRSYRERIADAIYNRKKKRKKHWLDYGKEEDTEGVFYGEHQPSMSLEEALDMGNCAMLITESHRFLLAITTSGKAKKKTSIEVTAYTPLGELVKEHKYSTLALMYAGMCGEYEDFTYHGWYVASLPPIEEKEISNDGTRQDS